MAEPPWLGEGRMAPSMLTILSSVLVQQQPGISSAQDGWKADELMMMPYGLA